MIGLAAGDEDRAIGFPDFDEILARHFERSFHCFRATRGKIDPVQPIGCTGHHTVGQRFHGFVGEKGGMGKRHGRALPVDRGNHILVAVPQTRDSRARAGIQITLAVAVNHIGAVASHRKREPAMGMPVQNA